MSTDLADHTNADADTNERAKVILRNLLAGREYDDRLTQAELTRRVRNALASRGVADDELPSKSTVRSLIQRVRSEYGLPVYSKRSGYWELQDPETFEDAIDRIDAAIETKRETKRELTEAFHDETMTHRKPPAGIYARHTADTSDEYAEHRIKSTDRPEYLRRIIEVEAERDDPRKERIGWANERLQEVNE